jgi:hypothetical protein
MMTPLKSKRMPEAIGEQIEGRLGRGKGGLTGT